MMSQDQRFLRREHLRHRKDFARVYARRSSSGDAALVVFVAENGLERSRLGISVSKRIGNAVCRARVRRRIREAFRKSKQVLPTGIDIICVAKRPAVDKETDLERSLTELIARATERSNATDRRTRPARRAGRKRSDQARRDPAP